MSQSQILQDALSFIEGLTASPLLMGDDIEMRLEDVQAHAKIEAASLRKRMNNTATPALSVESEEAAKLVYDAMVWARGQQPGTAVPKWIDGGNSDAQHEARRVVRKIAELAPSPSPAAKGGDAEAERFDYLSDAQARELFGTEDDDELPDGRVRVCEGEWVRIPGGYYFDGSAGLLHPETASAAKGEEVGLDFGAAIVALKDGRWVRRAGWNGKNMHVYLEEMGVSRMPRADAKGRILYSENGKVLPHLVLFNAQGERQPGWNASQADMLAEDWEIVSWEEMR